MKKLLILSFALLCAMVADAKVQLPQLFQSNMVLQRGKPIPVWGTADAGETIRVTFKKKTYETTADANGKWKVVLPQQKAGGPFELRIESGALDLRSLATEGTQELRNNSDNYSQITLENVLIGDVWLCSGQSNIDVTIERVYPQYGKVIDDYSNDRVRMFRVQTDFDTHGPKGDVRPTPINWKPVTKDNAWLFSAVGYFLGREMFEKTGVPQGIIVNSLGGTPIQAWLAADTIRQHFPELYQQTEFFQDDEMVRALQRGNAAAQNRWQKMLTDTDPGFSQHFSAREYNDSKWEKKRVFSVNNGRMNSVNLSSDFRYTGSFWARQHVTIDAAHAGKPCRLLVGTLFDADQTYVNGKQVGSTGYQYPPRRYTIPAGLLVEGDNALSVRFVTKGGSPHFIPEKPYKLIFDDGKEVLLSDEWLIHEGARMPQTPSANAGGQNLPSVLYNAMLYPLAPYALSGVVWYQGESNSGGDSRNYEQWLTQLVSGWRQLWQMNDLPFVLVQLANYMAPSDTPQETGWTTVRAAQGKVAATVPGVGLAVAIDLGETVDIHPLRKREVAQRVAMSFDKMLWNKKLQLYPTVISNSVNGDAVELKLDQKLKNEGTLYEFEIAGADGRFVNAEATGSGNTIVVRSSVKEPRRLRYAWKNNPLKANVFGVNNLPMAPLEINL